jgi:lipid-A-disaccharide synthase-like uncharacterized protein
VDPDIAIHPAITIFGIVGMILFQSRFFVQWMVSEYHKKSVMPPAFWYLSSLGSVSLMEFAILTQSPLGVLNHCINIVIYIRNIVHIWREKGYLTPGRSKALHIAMSIIALTGLAFLIRTWALEWGVQQEKPTEEALVEWGWLLVGVIGTGLFGIRMIIQWIATEKQKKSVVPNVFWYLSCMAALLSTAAFVHRAEWIFAVGSGLTLLIYGRNIWFILQGKQEELQE